MQPHRISSTKNPLVRRFRRAAEATSEVMVAEGVRLVQEALRARVPVIEAVHSERLLRSPRGREVLAGLERAADLLQPCSDEVLERISKVGTHQGVAAILRRPRLRLDDLLGIGGPALVVIAAGLRDPGNLGALVRTAEASGATGVVSLRDGADPFRDKALRASAGSAFRLPTAGGVDLDAVLDLVRRAGLQLLVADRDAGAVYDGVDFRLPTALVVGGEAGGLPATLVEAADRAVRVPMRSGVDSLNVAVAAGVLLYEARRQRS